MKIITEFKIRDEVARKMDKKQYKATRRWLRIVRSIINRRMKMLIDSPRGD